MAAGMAEAIIIGRQRLMEQGEIYDTRLEPVEGFKAVLLQP
jgi:hypothetical protein